MQFLYFHAFINTQRMRRLPILPMICLLMAMPATLFAQFQKPEEFLGYPLGTRYTPHYRIVQYVQSLAQAMPGKVKTLTYWKTYEGRPLMLAFISSEEHIRNLESVRLNNLRLSGTLRDNTQPSESTPVLVWLSYNVHGNEPSSSEAAMKTMYALLDPKGKA